MLDALGWEQGAVVASLERYGLEVRAEQIAATAVMAGCLPAYAPVLRPIAEMLLDPAFNLQGVATTTGGAGIAVIVSGPIVEELGFHYGANVLGGGVRINATVGRFAALVRRFCGLAAGQFEAFGAIGHPGQISYCLPEHATHWTPFHTQLGLSADSSAVTVVAAEGPNSVNNHYGETAHQILETIADCLAHHGSTNFYFRRAGYTVLIAPEHMAIVGAELSREDARGFLLAHARRETRDLIRLGRIPANPREEFAVDADTARSPVRSEDQLTFIESGGAAGKFSAVIPHWVGNVTRTREIGA